MMTGIVSPAFESDNVPPRETHWNLWKWHPNV